LRIINPFVDANMPAHALRQSAPFNC